MSYKLFTKPIIASALGIFLSYQGVYASENKKTDNQPESEISDLIQSTGPITDCDKVLPLTVKSYCDFSWGQKWDITQSYLRFLAGNGEYKKLFESLDGSLGYPKGFLSGVGYAESRFNQKEISYASAYGVMQIAAGYKFGLLPKYKAAKTLLMEYVDKDSLNKVVLHDPSSANNVKLTSLPLFQDIKESYPEIAKLLVVMYNIRDKWFRIDTQDPEIWNDTSVKKPSQEELEVIIRHVFVPLYKSVEYAKQQHFGGELPSLEQVRSDAQTNIVAGALIYDLGRKELSILSHAIDDNQKTHFQWVSPEIHLKNGTSAVHPDDLNVMAFGPYNAGFSATIWRLQLMYDSLSQEGPLRAEHALARGAFYRQTRIGMRSIQRWFSLYNFVGNISNQFIREEKQREIDDK